MKKNEIWFYISLIVLLTTIILLLTGSSLLTFALDKEDSIPLGSFITWAGLISLPLTLYWGIKELRNPTTKAYGYLAKTIKIVILIAVLWVPISYLLAGNLSFNFSEKASFQGGQIAMKWFWGLSFGIPVATLLTLIIHSMIRLLKHKN
ncbi:MAG: hypothetical protein HKN96_05565 [Flavobacteriaceae bacterium]|nr:hypothetical protein [Flavobacteriaceae bacterium]